MIKEYTSDIATQMGIRLSRISVIEGQRVGCFDVHLLNLSAENQRVSTLVYQSELDKLQNGSSSERLEVKIRGALSKLQTLMES